MSQLIANSQRQMQNSRSCPSCGHGDHIVDDNVKGMSYCEVHKITISNTIIQNNVEFIGETGKTMGMVMPRYGCMQPMIRQQGFGSGNLW